MSMTNRREFIKVTGAAIAAMSGLPLSVYANSKLRLPTRKIPGTNESLPIIGLGNSVAFQSGNLKLSRQLIDIFMKKGGAYIDTLGPSRFTVGQIMQEKNAHKALFLGSYISAIEKSAGRKEIKSIQKAQGGGVLDLVLTRNIDHFTTNADMYRRWKDEGLTRYIGVARHNKSFYDSMMKLMTSKKVDLIQVNYSMLELEAEQRLLPMARDKGIPVVINRPFINGKYFSLVKGKTLPKWAAEFDCYSWAQFSLKFILAHPSVTCVLTETANPKHAVDNLNAGFGRLPDKKTRLRMLKLIRGLAK